ncbi:hypothetical protein ACWGIR_23185 [Streptomyces albidoflavus]
MDNRLSARHEQRLRDLDPVEYPDIAALLRLVDGQRRVIHNKEAKIQRQATATTKVKMVADQWKQQTLDLTAENEQLKAEIARLRASLEGDR